MQPLRQEAEVEFNFQFFLISCITYSFRSAALPASGAMRVVCRSGAGAGERSALSVA